MNIAKSTDGDDANGGKSYNCELIALSIIHEVMGIMNFILLIGNHIFISNFFFQTSIINEDCMSATKSNFEFFFGFMNFIVIWFIIYFKTEEYIIFNLGIVNLFSLWQLYYHFSTHLIFDIWMRKFYIGHIVFYTTFAFASLICVIFFKYEICFIDPFSISCVIVLFVMRQTFNKIESRFYDLSKINIKNIKTP